jgi:glutamate/tyrosine decarboxylase-like PLP-dependent enzyme
VSDDITAFHTRPRLHTYKSSAELSTALDLSLPEHVSSPSDSQSAVVASVRELLDASVNTAHPCFFDKLYVGSDSIGQLSELLIGTLNTNVHTYAVSPALSMVEVEVIRKLCEIVGYDPLTSDGIFAPGGTMANLFAAVAARNTCLSNVKLHGIASSSSDTTGRPVMLAAKQAHYCARRSAMVTGLGMHDGVIDVSSDINGRMDPQDLHNAIVRAKVDGLNPFYVHTTAGTTVTGGFDPLDEIADVAQEHGLWMHVDAALGGSVLMSNKQEHRDLMKGVHRADSVVWNAHKLMGIPVACSVLLMRNKGILQSSNASAAEYLFHQHSESDYDLGDKSLQCGRRADALKLFLGWKYHGRQGFGARIDAALEKAQKFSDLLSSERYSNAFRLAIDRQSVNVCFWFVPPSLRASIPPASDAHANRAALVSIFDELDSATQVLYSRMQQRGEILVNFNPLPEHNLPRFFRIVLNNPNVTNEHLELVLDQLQELGKDL